MLSSISSLTLDRGKRLLAGLGACAAFTGVVLGQTPSARADFNQNSYDWCMNNLEEGSDYCCEHAGGVVRSGACIDPATLRVDGGLQTTPSRTFKVPPEILAPQATAVNPGMT